MLKMTLGLVLGFVLALGLASSCKKDDGAKKEPAPTARTKDPSAKTPATKPPVAVAKPTASEADVAAALAVMTPYEACRTKLAADKGDLAECAAQIAEVAAKKTDGPAADAMKEIATAAAALAKAPADDIEGLRVAFGDVSKPVEAMLTAIPAAAAKYKVYECPMAKGFKRWAQPIEGETVAMANPYMGTKMLECGSEVYDHHTGAMKSGDMKSGGMKHGDMKQGDMKKSAN